MKGRRRSERNGLGLQDVRAHAAGLGIDPHRLAAGGGSAGGHLAAATATIIDVNEAGEDPAVSAEPNALVLFNPAVNLQIPKIKDSFGDETYEIMKPLSPYQRITKDLPPTASLTTAAATAKTTKPPSRKWTSSS